MLGRFVADMFCWGESLRLEPDAMSHIARNGTSAYIGLPEREALKLQDLWQRDELGVELSVEVHAPVVVGIYPIRIARFVLDQAAGQNGHANGHAYAPVAPSEEPMAPQQPIAPQQADASPE